MLYPVYASDNRPRISIFSHVVHGVGATFIIAACAIVLVDWLVTARFQVHGFGAVIVSGASSGIGEHVASTLAATTSLTVFAGVRKPEDARRLTAKYPHVRPIFLDVTSSESIAAAVRFLVDEHPHLPLVGLVNNAGVQSDLPVELQTHRADRYTFDVNVFGLLDVTRAFLPALRRTGNGARIVNVGSLAGLVASPGSATYSASKHAVEGITDSLRRELKAFGVSVSLLEPVSAVPLLPLCRCYRSAAALPGRRCSAAC